MQTAVQVLSQAVTYSVPEQDLTVNLRRIPALPASGFLLHDVRMVPSDTARQCGLTERAQSKFP